MLSKTLSPALADELARYREDRDALILAHSYQPSWVKEIADVVGDSLALARSAALSSHRTLVMCGVRFMAETAKLLAPDRRVLLPTPEAGCSLADAITVEDLQTWRDAHPEALVVAYVNTSAAVKALADICCTSANAIEIVETIPRDREVLMVPDFFLGSWVREVTGRERLSVWMGECHVHAEISPQALRAKMAQHPEAEVFVHPECGCSTPALWYAPELPRRPKLLSTSQMLTRSRTTTARSVLVATEVGLLDDLRRANPDVEFLAVNPEARCPYMNLCTPEGLVASLREGTEEIVLDPTVIEAAACSVRRMLDPSSAPWINR